jgi:hypothetical protein
MRARVLSTERYWFDGASSVSPIDFAVGWGRMSDQRHRPMATRKRSAGIATGPRDASF